MLKILPVLACVLVIAAGSVALAARSEAGFSPSAPENAGGFAGPGISVTTAKQAATMRDDCPVVLRGNIVQHLGKDDYLFGDASGTIRVEIDHDKWRGQNVTPHDTVEIHGKIDKDWNSVEVEVDRITLLK